MEDADENMNLFVIKGFGHLSDEGNEIPEENGSFFKFQDRSSILNKMKRKSPGKFQPQ